MNADIPPIDIKDEEIENAGNVFSDEIPVQFNCGEIFATYKEQNILSNWWIACKFCEHQHEYKSIPEFFNHVTSVHFNRRFCEPSVKQESETLCTEEEIVKIQPIDVEDNDIEIIDAYNVQNGQETIKQAKVKNLEGGNDGVISGKIKRSSEAFDVLKYFDGTHSTAFCKIGNCRQKLIDFTVDNLKRHIISSHSTFAEGLGLKLFKTSNMINENNIKVPMTRESFIKNCLKMVTVDKFPFRILDSEGFTPIKNAICSELKLTISATSIINTINEAAEKIKEKICEDLTNKIISLKIDIITRLGESILGINVQHIKDGKVEILTLGIVELQMKPTVEFLKKAIMNVLLKYKIEISQIYSCACDNSTNMIDCKNLFSSFQNENLIQSESFEQNFPEIFNSSLSSEIDDTIENNNVVTIETTLSNVLNCIRCAPHTLQLCANKIIRLDQQHLERIRNIVKELKNLKYNQLHIKNISKPRLDTITRWSSTYLMLKNLLENKQTYNNFEQILIDDFSWTYISQFVEVFEPVYNCSKKFQEQHLVVGDFYLAWLEMKMKVTKIKDNNLAEIFLKMLNEGEKKLFNNNIFRAAIYMDPRLNFSNSRILSQIDKIEAEKHLNKTWQLIKRFEKQSSKTIVPNDDNLNLDKNELDYFIEMTVKTNKQETIEKNNIKQKIHNLQFQKRCLSSTNVLDYWNNQKDSETELFKISQIVLATPVAQFSLQRTFSALPLPLTPVRTESKKDIMQNIFLIKFNKQYLSYITLNDAN